VLSRALHRSPTFRPGAPAGAGAVFQSLDRAEKVTKADFVALGIRRIEQPLVDRYADGFLFRLAALGLGQLYPDVELEFVQEALSPVGMLIFSPRGTCYFSDAVRPGQLL
jgi:hypothetical protein